MTRLQRILVVTLVLQVILAGIVFYTQRPVLAETSELLGDFEAEKVVALTIQDDDDNVLELARVGDEWNLASGGGYPADNEAVTAILDKLESVQTNRLVTRTAASHKRLQVADDDFSTALHLELEDGSQYDLFVGTSPNPRSVHIRLANQDEVYLTDKLIGRDVDATASNWIDAAYVNLDRDQITAMVLENANGTFELQKIDDEWTLEGLAAEEEFDSTGSNQLLSQLTTMRMTEPLGMDELSEFGLDSPQAVLRVTTENDEGNSQTHTLSIGAHDAEGDTYIVKWSDSPYFVSVAGFAGDSLVETMRDDFIKEPPTGDTSGEATDSG
jgi:hypothetical protein